MDGGVLFDVLFVERGLDLEGLQVGEVDILGDGCSDGAMGGVDVSGDLEVVARSCVDGARDVSVGRGVEICGDVGSGHGKRVAGDGSANQRGTAIEIEQERGGRGEITVGVEYAQSYGMGLTVIQQRGEGSQIDAVGLEVQGLDARNWNPEFGVDAAGEDPGVDWGDAGGVAVDGDFGLAERSVAATFQFASKVAGNAEIPEFVGRLALGKDIEECALDVGGKSQSLFEQAGRGIEGDGAAGGASGEGDDLVGGAGRLLIRRQRVEEHFGGAVEDAGVGAVHNVEKIDGAVLGNGKDGTVVCEVALNAPVAALAGLILGGRTEIDVGGADPDVGGAVVLNPGGNGEIGLQNDGGPGTGTIGGRGVGEALGSVNVEFESAKELHRAGGGIRMRHGWIGGGGVAGADGLGGGEGGKEYEQHGKRDGEFRERGGHCGLLVRCRHLQDRNGLRGEKPLW